MAGGIKKRNLVLCTYTEDSVHNDSGGTWPRSNQNQFDAALDGLFQRENWLAVERTAFLVSIQQANDLIRIAQLT